MSASFSAPSTARAKVSMITSSAWQARARSQICFAPSGLSSDPIGGSEA